MEQLKAVLSHLNISYTDLQIDQFRAYESRILEWNKKVNLTAITVHDDFIKKHFIDSIAISQFDEFKGSENIIDVGTGAGFPGVPLAILHPEKRFLLMDSLNKRIKIIDEICFELGICNVDVIHGRAEEIAQSKKYREKYDFCVSRAVANLSVLSEYCIPFVKVGGYFAPYKSGTVEEEIKDSMKAIKILGGVFAENRRICIDGFDLDHRVILIKKIEHTNSKYPRKAGTPAKEPIK